MKMLSRMGLAIALILPASTATTQAEDLYPNVAEISHADPAVVEIFKSYFTAKSRQQVDATMDHFRRDMLTYSDATLGWDTSDFESERKIFATYMPNWGKGRSYPTRIIGGPKSAIVEFTDTPELFGGELRIFGAVDFKEGKILRWADYWDSTTYDDVALQKILVPKDKFPTTYREEKVGSDNASPRIVAKAKAFQKALAEGDAAAVGNMLTYDAVYEDAVLHTQIVGRAGIQAYLARVLAASPFGRGATLRHVVGGDMGGGFEWSGAASSPVRVGITSLTLDAGGQISRVAVMYDGRLLPRAEKERLVLLSMDK
jgi:ketosteroid isomerase-like protein